MIGLLFGLAFRGGWLPWERGPLLRAGIVVFAVLFPLVYATLTDATVYDGIRHFLFVVPPMTALAAAGWAGALRAAARWRSARVALATALVLLVAEPIAWYARSHPFEYVYFNPLAGGLAKASHSYETDYWGLSLRSAAEWLAEYRLQRAGADGPLVLTTNARWHLLAPWLDDPSKYTLRAGAGLQATLMWYRTAPPDWESSAPPTKEAVLVEGQVPFWQIYVERGSQANKRRKNR
jgi:hypothetical protein